MNSVSDQELQVKCIVKNNGRLSGYFNFLFFLSQQQQNMKALLSQKDIATSLAEDLLKQFAQGAELDLDPTQASPSSDAMVANVAQNPPSNIRIATEPTPVLAYGGPMGRPSLPRMSSILLLLFFFVRRLCEVDQLRFHHRFFSLRFGP